MVDERDASPGRDDAVPPPELDPALNYPRGNRLGIRHPRPTVVIVGAVLVALAVAYAWSAIAGGS